MVLPWGAHNDGVVQASGLPGNTSCKDLDGATHGVQGLGGPQRLSCLLEPGAMDKCRSWVGGKVQT